MTLYNIYTYPYLYTHIYLLPYIDRCRLLFYISIPAWPSSCCLLSFSSHVLYHFLFFPLPLLHLLYPSYSYLDFLLLFIFEMCSLFSCRFIIYPPDTFLTCFSPILIFLSDILFYCWLVRKLPWLSRQSDRLLTDRSLVRSQAEASFLLFPTLLFDFPMTPLIDFFSVKKVRLPWVSNPRPRG